MNTIDFAVELRARLAARSTPVPSGCIEWRGSTDKSGYGTFTFRGRTMKAHRVALTLALDAPIPTGLCACHSCDNRRCVNPEHLWAGTVGENNEDMRRKGRLVARPALPGEGHHSARLTWRQVAEARAARAGGARPAELARRYGVSIGTMSPLLAGKTWKDPS